MSLESLTVDLEEVARTAPRVYAEQKWHRDHADGMARRAEERREELMGCVAGLFQFILEDENARMGLDAYVQEQVRHVAHEELNDAVIEIVRDNAGYLDLERGSPQSHQHEVELDLDLGALGSFNENITTSPADE